VRRRQHQLTMLVRTLTYSRKAADTHVLKGGDLSGTVTWGLKRDTVKIACTKAVSSLCVERPGLTNWRSLYVRAHRVDDNALACSAPS
jgi:hypothetical protein